jgi:hypothetical protein
MRGPAGTLLAGALSSGEAGVNRGVLTCHHGDVLVLDAEIEHRPNLRRVEALFIGRPDAEAVSPHEVPVLTEDLHLRGRRADGTKLSVARFEMAASRSDWAPGYTYEVARLRAWTTEGSIVVLDVSCIERPRLRFVEDDAEEPSRAAIGSIKLRLHRLIHRGS